MERLTAANQRVTQMIEAIELEKANAIQDKDNMASEVQKLKDQIETQKQYYITKIETVTNEMQEKYNKVNFLKIHNTKK